MKGKIVALILILLVFEVLIIFAMYYFITVGKCDYDNSSKVYIKHTQPCVINFLCTADKIAFSDQCGCGCKLKT
jgi:mannose/fructose/N-acetylgalactosamine-specific phosphotransferase system component IID